MSGHQGVALAGTEAHEWGGDVAGVVDEDEAEVAEVVGVEDEAEVVHAKAENGEA